MVTPALLTDPLFYLLSVPAVLLYGVAKGGFAGPAAVLAVPLMSILMSPSQAAAILLPILVVMDVFVLRTYWGKFDRTAVKILLPAALVGIGVGYLLAQGLSDSGMRIVIGVITLLFGLKTLIHLQSAADASHNAWSGSFFGALAGFTSFSIHAGGPPLAMYLMPRKLDPLLYAGTSGVFFAVVNSVKLVPYYSLGQLGTSNLLLSALLVPLAPIGVALGHWLVARTEADLYYRLISFFLVVVGVKLLWDGFMAAGY